MSSYYSYQTNTPRMFTPAEQEQFELARLGSVTPAQQEAFLDYHVGIFMSSYYSYQTNTPRMFTPAEQEQFELARLGSVTPAQQEAFLDYGYEPRAAQGAGAKAETDWGNTFGLVGLGLAVGQALSSVYSAWASSKTQAAVQKAQSKIAANNAESMQMGVEMSLGLAVGQALSSVYSAWASSKTQAAVQKAQSKIAANNAESMQMGVEMSRRQGEAIIGKLTRRAGQTKATQRTRAAANGIGLGTGNIAEIMATTDLLKEEDMKTAELNAIAQSWGYAAKGASLTGRSNALGILGSANSDVALGNAFAAGLEGAGRVASYWQSFRAGVGVRR